MICEVVNNQCGKISGVAIRQVSVASLQEGVVLLQDEINACHLNIHYRQITDFNSGLQPLRF